MHALPLLHFIHSNIHINIHIHISPQGTNARLNGHEICDCHRESPPSRPGNIENRYYHHPASGVSVTFLQWFNDAVGYSGHDLQWLNVTLPKKDKKRRAPPETPLDAAHLFSAQNGAEDRAFTPTQTGCRAGECNGTVPLAANDGNTATDKNASAVAHPPLPPHTWSHDVYGLFERVVPQLQPDYLLFNRGHWGRLPGPYDLERLAEAVQAAVQPSGGRAIFRTTTPKAYVKNGSLSRLGHAAYTAPAPAAPAACPRTSIITHPSTSIHTHRQAAQRVRARG